MICQMQVMCLYITGHLDEIFSPEHKKEILRYIYNHQVSLEFFLILLHEKKFSDVKLEHSIVANAKTRLILPKQLVHQCIQTRSANCDCDYNRMKMEGGDST